MLAEMAYWVEMANREKAMAGWENLHPAWRG